MKAAARELNNLRGREYEKSKSNQGKEDAKNILKTMIKDGFYVSTEVYAGFLELIG